MKRNPFHRQSHPHPRSLAQEFVKALERVNHLAHALSRGSRLQTRVYAAKHALVSAALEADLGCRPAWQLQPSGQYQLLVSIDQARCFHVYFENLTTSAKARVLSAIGGVPDTPRGSQG